MQNEIYKKIVGYSNYSISNWGNVRNDKSKRIKRVTTSADGYLMTSLCEDGEAHGFGVHRLIAIAFIPNPEHKTQVDHIDTNRLNNKLDNLRWASNSENNYNSKIRTDNTSGSKGVYFDKSSNKWRVQINVNGKRLYVGRFTKKEDAIKARI